jgi:hypothetical protein
MRLSFAFPTQELSQVSHIPASNQENMNYVQLI